MSGGDELTRQVRTLTTAGARIALAAAEAAARAKGAPFSIAVVDAAGSLLGFVRLDGAPVPSIDAAMRKARTAAQFGAPSKVFEDVLKGGVTSLLAFEAVCPSQGAVPIIVDGVVIGAVGGSGGSGEDDEAVAQAGADAVAAALPRA
jgi:glc operon protein GlcG